MFRSRPPIFPLYFFFLFATFILFSTQNENIQSDSKTKGSFTSIESASNSSISVQSPISSTALRIRLTPIALVYLNDIACGILSEQLPHIIIPNIHHRQRNQQGLIILSRIRVSRYKRAEGCTLSTSEPNKIAWRIKNLNIGFIGDLSGEINIVVPLKLEGEVEIQGKGIDFYLQSAVKRSSTGAAQLVPLSCRTSIKMVTIDNHNGGLAGLALNIFKVAISEHFRPLIQSLICKKVLKYAESELNMKLSRSQTQSTIFDAVKMNSFGEHFKFVANTSKILRNLNIRPSEASNRFMQNLAKRLFVDYRLSEDPICYNDTVEMANHGEISAVNSSLKTAFIMPLLEWPASRNKSHSMIEILMSDYVANALLYHAFAQNLLKFEIDERTVATAKNFLTTTCPNFFCIADVLPDLAIQYPNSKVQLVLTATSIPDVEFSETFANTISSNVHGLIAMNVYKNRNQRYKRAASFEANLVANIKLELLVNLQRKIMDRDGVLLGSITIDEFSLIKKLKTSIVNDDELVDLSLFTAQFLQDLINDVLKTGIPLPVPEGVYLEATNLQILNRKVLVSSKFSFDRERIKQVVMKTIFNSTFLSGRRSH